MAFRQVDVDSEDGKEIVNLFKKTKAEQISEPDEEPSNSVHAELNNLPVVIEHYTYDEKSFFVELGILENDHRLVKWTAGGYIVRYYRPVRTYSYLSHY